MGTESPSGKNRRRGLKVSLWATLTCLALLAGVITGSPSPESRQLDTGVGEQPTTGDVDSMSTANQGLLEAGGDDSTDLPLKGTWNPLYVDNVTSNGHSHADFADDLLLRAERSPAGQSKPKKKDKKPQHGGRRGRGGRGCRIRSLTVKVRDLGLGYDSDEIVLFKYCTGICHHSRNNYDMTLAHLIKQKTISSGLPDKVSSHPCCRPTRYEPVSFMDIKNMWQTVDKLSAAECSCIG